MQVYVQAVIKTQLIEHNKHFESQQGRQAQLAGLQGQLGQGMFGMGITRRSRVSRVRFSVLTRLWSTGQQYGSMAPALQGLQQNDINQQLALGGLGRGRQQSLMDLGYQNFTGQYNLPMQTLQNVGSIASALGPLAGGYGYAGANPTTNAMYAPSGGSTYNQTNPFFGGLGNYFSYT